MKLDFEKIARELDEERRKERRETGRVAGSLLLLFLLALWSRRRR